MAKKEKSLFWASYADLMTSLFFVMLVLFIGSIVVLEQRWVASEKEKKVLQEINDATKNIDSTYFEYKEEYKKHKLKIEVNFKINDYIIENLPLSTQSKLLVAGSILNEFINNATKQNPNIQYLLVIEGQASRLGGEDLNYHLSYQRAYELKKFWENHNIKFTAKNCEVLICGSGDGRQSGTGLMREENERLNQRFLIHILPKPGQANENKTFTIITNDF